MQFSSSFLLHLRKNLHRKRISICPFLKKASAEVQWNVNMQFQIDYDCTTNDSRKPLERRSIINFIESNLKPRTAALLRQTSDSAKLTTEKLFRKCRGFNDNWVVWLSMHEWVSVVRRKSFLFRGGESELNSQRNTKHYVHASLLSSFRAESNKRYIKWWKKRGRKY